MLTCNRESAPEALNSAVDLARLYMTDNTEKSGVVELSDQDGCHAFSQGGHPPTIVPWVCYV
jgi:hypothetical protein